MTMTIDWTPELIARILIMHKTMSVRAMALRLPVSREAIRGKLKEMGLTARGTETGGDGVRLRADSEPVPGALAPIRFPMFENIAREDIDRRGGVRPTRGETRSLVGCAAEYCCG